MNPFEKTFSNTAKQSNHDSSHSSGQHADNSIEYKWDNEAKKDILLKIAAYKPSRYNKQAPKFTKRIVLGAHHDIMPVFCTETGSIAGMFFPTILGKGFSYISPLADYKNCRGIVQEGRNYLSKLDSQTLAAILITIANRYELLRFQPTDSGVQKNALLRTIDREILIDLLILIEERINTANYHFLPRFSLILDQETLNYGLSNRAKEWAKTLVDSIWKPDLESYESATAVKRSPTPASMSPAKKAQNILSAEFKEWKKDAKEDIQELFLTKKISLKLKSYLTAILSEETIAAADSSTIVLFQERLNQLDDPAASDLADQIGYFHSKFHISLDAEWDSGESFASKPVGSNLPIEASIDSSEQDTPKEIEQPVVPLTFSQKMLLKKRMEAQAKQEQNKEENNGSDF